MIQVVGETLIKIVILLFCDFLLLGIVSVMTNGMWFNPKENYQEWCSLNWFGVGLFTLIYWVVFLPFTIIYMVCKILTVGRK